jgi:hypothetical protein
MRKLQLRQLIKEELNRYMFFQNLKSIKMMVDEILELDENMVDDVLNDGHDWADDHITTSKDDIEEVYNFLITKQVPMTVNENTPKYKKGDMFAYKGSRYTVISDDGYVVKAERNKDGYKIMLNYSQLANVMDVQ